ncbi:hypothetical protein [Azohydromonas lata]|uniref:DUF4433 domain-containing protein n=1 Tax=Azohydromonas lata TaxID=45677 RepID=A0ABU5IK47_9BURK|nr:hypothetical protein [Azohydromonas lata]MDZ5459273.1 hypothetical protein [Azohydromonas lata]
MKFEAISLSYGSATRKIVPRLKGRVFHITSPANFISIIKSGAISNNQNGVFPKNWNCSSYFANKGCVSVCDLVNNKKPRVTRQRFLSDYRIFGQGWGATTVFMFLSPFAHKQLITWRSWQKEKAYGQQVVPDLESGFPGEILLGDIEEIWFLTITDIRVSEELIKAMESPFMKADLSLKSEATLKW